MSGWRNPPVDMRTRWKWLALIAIVIAVAFWFTLGDAPVVTTLRLDRPATDGAGNELWFEVRSPRMVGFITTEYSIEAQTATGLTNYDAPPFGHVYSNFEGGGAIPIRVTVPNADEFRVKVVLEEYGAFRSRFEVWAARPPANQYRIVQIADNWFFRMHRKRSLTTVWSPWVVRSNNVWIEKAAR